MYLRACKRSHCWIAQRSLGLCALIVKQFIWECRRYKEKVRPIFPAHLFISPLIWKSLNSLMPLLSLQTVNILSACIVMSVVWQHAGALCCVSPSLSFFVDGPVISICLCYVCRCISFFHSTLKSCYSVSFTYCTFDVWPPQCWFLLCCACDIAALFSVLSQYSSCRLSVAAVSCEGYLAAISAFIFALSSGLLQRCCPRVIIRHHQGGDLSLWQHLEMHPGMS